MITFRTVNSTVGQVLSNLPEGRRHEAAYREYLAEAGKKRAKEMGLNAAAISELSELVISDTGHLRTLRDIRYLEPEQQRKYTSLFIINLLEPVKLNTLRVTKLADDIKWYDAAKRVYFSDDTALVELLDWPEPDGTPDSTLTFTQTEGAIVDTSRQHKDPWKENGFRWDRTKEQWYLPQSAGRNPFDIAQRSMRAVRAAVAAGQTVAVDFDPGDLAARREGIIAKLTRGQERAARRMRGYGATLATADRMAHEALERLPAGQPFIGDTAADRARRKEQARERRVLDAAEDARGALDADTRYVDRASRAIERQRRTLDSLQGASEEDRLLWREDQRQAVEAGVLAGLRTLGYSGRFSNYRTGTIFRHGRFNAKDPWYVSLEIGLNYDIVVAQPKDPTSGRYELENAGKSVSVKRANDEDVDSFVARAVEMLTNAKTEIEGRREKVTARKEQTAVNAQVFGSLEWQAAVRKRLDSIRISAYPWMERSKSDKRYDGRIISTRFYTESVLEPGTGFRSVVFTPKIDVNVGTDGAVLKYDNPIDAPISGKMVMSVPRNELVESTIVDPVKYADVVFARIVELLPKIHEAAQQHADAGLYIRSH